MTVLLKKAFNKVSSLSEKEQNELAQLILDEISEEEKWSYNFSKSQDELSILAPEAVKKIIKIIIFFRLQSFSFKSEL